MAPAAGHDQRQPRRLDTSLLRPPDVVLTIEGTDYTIRGNLPVETMIALFELEERVRHVPDDDGRALLQVVEEANQLIRELIHERDPDASIPKMGMDEVLGVLAFLAGNDSVAAEVVSALSDDGAGRERGAGGGEGEDEVHEPGEGEDAGPLASASSSSRRSSRSAKRTAGPRSTGAR